MVKIYPINSQEEEMKKSLVSVSLLVIVLLISGTFFDLYVSKEVYYQESFYALFYENLAPVIYGVMIMISVSLVFIPTFVMRGITVRDKILSGVTYFVFSCLGVFSIYVYLEIWGW